ncbi:MAG: hypothetical protein AB7K67_02195 [Hyphomicrobiaceae bacterium]|jgi:hypothetical protein
MDGVIENLIVWSPWLLLGLVVLIGLVRGFGTRRRIRRLADAHAGLEKLLAEQDARLKRLEQPAAAAQPAAGDFGSHTT